VVKIRASHDKKKKKPGANTQKLSAFPPTLWWAGLGCTPPQFLSSTSSSNHPSLGHLVTHPRNLLALSDSKSHPANILLSKPGTVVAPTALDIYHYYFSLLAEATGALSPSFPGPLAILCRCVC